MENKVIFDRKILESLGTNKDMLTSFILAATADTGRGVKICAGLWPHLTPPARVGGVARALVKAGVLSPAPERGPGWYFVKTQASAEQAPARRAGGEAEAKQQRQTSERAATSKQSESAETAVAREAATDNTMQKSGAEAANKQTRSDKQANTQRQTSKAEAAQQQAESSAEAKQTDEIDPADLDELASLPTPFFFNDNQPESLNKPQKAMSPLEVRARKIAERECPQGQNFEVFFEQNRLRFIVAARG